VRGILVGAGRVNGEDKGRGIWSMCFVYIYDIEQ
jgi:hypothetical protein